MAADTFFVDAYTTRLADDELITEVAFPLPARGTTGAYLKLERRAGDFAVVSVAVQLSLDPSGICHSAAGALGAAGRTPIKVVEAEAFLSPLGPTHRMRLFSARATGPQSPAGSASAKAPPTVPQFLTWQSPMTLIASAIKANL